MWVNLWSPCEWSYMCCHDMFWNMKYFIWSDHHFVECQRLLCIECKSSNTEFPKFNSQLELTDCHLSVHVRTHIPWKWFYEETMLSWLRVYLWWPRLLEHLQSKNNERITLGIQVLNSINGSAVWWVLCNRWCATYRQLSKLFAGGMHAACPMFWKSRTSNLGQEFLTWPTTVLCPQPGVKFVVSWHLYVVVFKDHKLSPWDATEQLTWKIPIRWPIRYRDLLDHVHVYVHMQWGLR